MAIVIVLILIVLGSVLFHLFNPWWLTPLASNWLPMDDTLTITVVITDLFFVAISVFLIYTLHDFFVPPFRARMNIVPGQVSTFWFTPTVVGRFEAMCAQLCGIGHANMRGYVVASGKLRATHRTAAAVSGLAGPASAVLAAAWLCCRVDRNAR